MQCQSWFRLSALLSVLALAACSKLSDVGQLTQPPPMAVAATVGQPYTIDGSGTLHTTVRAGADVVLTGVNSKNGAADTGIPIIYFDWAQLNPGSNAVDLIKRASNTSSFTAPQVTAKTTLTFQLTVRTATGATANTQAVVDVEPIRDGDHFLTFLGVNDTFNVTAVTSALVPASPAAYNATIPFTITVTKLVTYTDIDKAVHTQVPVGKPVTISGSWSAALGSGGPDCTDPRNPQIRVPIPQLNLDDALPAGGHLSDLLETSDVDLDPVNPGIPAVQVYAQVQIQLGATGSQTTALPGGATPQVCIGGPGTPGTLRTAIAGGTFSSADLTATANPGGAALYDTSATAHAYYDAIDSGHTRTTLSDWLSVNHFDTTLPNWGADAHAVYTNNFDLGLGRDMYLKVGSCDSGYTVEPLSQFAQSPLSASTAQKLKQSVGHCDIAAVVVNYVGVQAAAEHLNQIVAVAMEYSAAAAGGARYTKFFVFAPDTRTGAMQRITSVDLDHRGQKYVPQSCVVCHGGTPGSYAINNGDVNSGFLPWDLDSLLYSDTDPGFSQKAEDAALKAQFTRTNQEAQLKALNVGAYLTTSAADPTRYALETELLEGWYGGAGLPGNYNGSFIPDGWKPTANGNPSTSDKLYTDVYARNCRACHVMQVPATGFDLSTGGAHGSGTAAACGASAGTAALGANPHQFPMGCYWQFANQPQLAQILNEGRMPLARRTMDRLWVDPSGATANGNGQELLTDLTNLYQSTNSASTVVSPGTPDVHIPAFPATVPGGVRTDVSDWIPLAVTDEVQDYGEFVVQPTWQVCLDPGTGSCAASASHVSVAGMDGISAAFQIPHSGNYLVELDSAGSALVTQPLVVTPHPPTISALQNAVPRQGTIPLVGSALIGAGNGSLASHQWWVSALSNLVDVNNTCLASSPCAVQGSTITLAETDPTATTGSYTVNVIDADGGPVVSTIQPVTITSGLTAVDPQSGYITANSSGQTVLNGGTALDLSAGNTAGAGNTIRAQISCDGGATWTTSCASGANSNGATGVASVQGTNLQYNPPAAFATNPPDGSSGTYTRSAVQITYRLEKFNSTNVLVDTSPAATLNLQVRSRVSWQTDVVSNVFNRTAVYPSGGGTCAGSGCHDGTQLGVISLKEQLSLTERMIYCSMVGCGSSSPATTPTTDPAGVFVTTNDDVNPTPSAAFTPNSVLLRHPADLDPGTLPQPVHTGSQRCAGGFTGSPPIPATPSTCDLTNILQWIEDGANDF